MIRSHKQRYQHWSGLGAESWSGFVSGFWSWSGAGNCPGSKSTSGSKSMLESTAQHVSSSSSGSRRSVSWSGFNSVSGLISGSGFYHEYKRWLSSKSKVLRKILGY